MKKELYVSILVCILLSFFTLTAKTQPSQSPDTKIRGYAVEVESATDVDYEWSSPVPHLIWVLITEILTKPDSFTRQIDQIISIYYNFSSPPAAKRDHFVEVYGLWVGDNPNLVRILVGENVAGSYVKVLPLPLQQPVSINTQSEYFNYSIPLSYQENRLVMSLWYDWVNTQSTQVISLAYDSRVYDSPVITFLGQRYAAPDGNEVFIGNTLSLMEAYKDSNGNNIPDATEPSYFLVVNSSAYWYPTPIEKNMQGEVAHYTWGLNYTGIDGFLRERNATSGVGATVGHMAFSYDYYLQGNVSYLKTDFDMGQVVVDGSPNMTLQGLSLSLVYSTMIITPKNYTVLVNEQPFNSTIAQPSSVATNHTEVEIDEQKTYEFLFGENYTRYKESVAESHNSVSFAVTAETIPPDARSLNWLLQQLENVLKEVFPKISDMQANIDLNYTASTFVYRVCYPSWEGYRIKHDPTYKAYINPSALPNIPPKDQPIIPINAPTELLIAAIIIGSAALVAAVYELRKIRRQQPPFTIQPVIR